MTEHTISTASSSLVCSFVLDGKRENRKVKDPMVGFQRHMEQRFLL